MTPRTEAGRRLLDGFAPMPLPDAQELHRRSAMGRRVKVAAGILAIEREAGQDAIKALGSFIWLGNNLHNSGTDTFREMYRAALADARTAYEAGITSLSDPATH